MAASTTSHPEAAREAPDPVIRFLLVAAAIVPATIWYGLRILWSVARSRPDAGCVCDAAPRRWARLLMRLSGVRVVLENAGAIDPDRPQILVANHVSWYDVLAITAHIPGAYVFVAKQELRSVPLFGAAAGACGHIFIDRGDRQRAVESLRDARRTLEDRRPTVIMFPEGTRSATGALQPFKKGAFVLAIQAGVEVVPAAILGSRDVMRKGSLLIRPGTIRIVFGSPLPVEGLELGDRDRLIESARSSVAGLQAVTTTH